MNEKVKRKRRKDKDVFPHTADLKIRGRRHLMRISQEEDGLATQTRFYFQDQENV